MLDFSDQFLLFKTEQCPAQTRLDHEQFDGIGEYVERSCQLNWLHTTLEWMNAFTWYGLNLENNILPNIVLLGGFFTPEWVCHG